MGLRLAYLLGCAYWIITWNCLIVAFFKLYSNQWQPIPPITNSASTRREFCSEGMGLLAGLLLLKIAFCEGLLADSPSDWWLCCLGWWLWWLFGWLTIVSLVTVLALAAKTDVGWWNAKYVNAKNPVSANPVSAKPLSNRSAWWGDDAKFGIWIPSCDNPYKPLQ